VLSYSFETPSPVRANQSSRVKQAPRSSYRNPGFDSYMFPPPPSVEDEAESLAKEYQGGRSSSSNGDEEPKFRGDIEQMPIILPVHEYNPERRFVLLGSDVGSAEDDSQAYPDSKRPPQYEANTCRKYVLVPSDDDKDDKSKKKRRPRDDRDGEPRDAPSLSRQRSRQDLPRIDTDLPRRPSTNSNTTEKRRHRPSVTIDQPPPQPQERRHRREDTRSSEGLLSPVIQHTTNGRDRAFWDMGYGTAAAGAAVGAAAAAAGSSSVRRSPSARERHDSRATSDDRRSHHGSKSPAAPYKRGSAAETPGHERHAEKEDRRASEREERRATDRERERYPLERTLSKKGSSSTRKASPTKHDRKSPSPPYSASTRDGLRARSGSYRHNRPSPPREEDEYSSDDYARSQRSERHGTRSRRTTVGQGDRSLHLAPGESTESFSSRPKSRAPTPLASPRLSQGGDFPENELGHSPRSATFPTERYKKRFEETPYPSDRTPSVFSNGAPHITMPVPIPVPMRTSGSDLDSVEGKRSNVPPGPPIYTRQGTSLESTSPKTPSWQPAPFNPESNRATLEKPVQSYRRYSEDVSQGVLPKLPDCPRMMPRPGLTDWLTIPRAENFAICPSCFEGVFAGTDFQHYFVPAQRDPTKPVACDFGSSPWYRIAYLMTLKHGYADLHLMQGVAAVAARYQTCAGPRSATRIWHSLMDPYHQLPIPSFSVCQGCAKTVEVLLPSLRGAFVPLDSPSEPSRGLCEMRFLPERKRFLEYFDLMETASDHALDRQSAPDLQGLADSVREISISEECHRAVPVHNHKWYVMEDLPELTVCQECFEAVVWPLMEVEREMGGEHSAGGGRPSTIARRFFQRKQARPLAACQLYSERMREVFRKACRRNDMEYLEDKVRERIEREQRMYAQLARVQREWKEAPDDPRPQEEVARLLREWKAYE
jgi:hypothetical protein